MNKRDLKLLENAHSKLYQLITVADKIFPVNVHFTYRTPELQFELYKKGREFDIKKIYGLKPEKR